MTAASTPCGVFLLGARGEIATTLVVGARALARGLAGGTGQVCELPPMSALDLVDPAGLVFGGLDIAEGDLYDWARSIQRSSATISGELLAAVADDLADIDANIVSDAGYRWNPLSPPTGNEPLAVLHTRLCETLQRFATRTGVDRVVVVNLTSTEPASAEAAALDRIDALREAVARDDRRAVTPGMLSALCAFDAGCAYLNFTPNLSVASPAVAALADERGLPFYGDDGKTGETLVKTALAPMFAARHLQILSWEGTNLLGNDDGRSLADPDNRAAKLRNKADVVERIVGYPVHSHARIHYVPSLGDWKTAWDLVHFRGFLDVPMTLQFTWQGCDSILAAPLVLDIVRLADFAMRAGESGPMTHLASFFKDPLDVDEVSFWSQFRRLVDYAVAHAPVPRGPVDAQAGS